MMRNIASARGAVSLLSVLLLLQVMGSTTSLPTITKITTIPSVSSIGNIAYAQTQNNTANMVPYTDPTSGITFQYPSSWTIRNVSLSLVPPETISAVRLLPPGQNATQSFLDNVIIGVHGIANATTTEQYTEQVLAAFNNLSGAITLMSSTPTTLAGNPAHQIEYVENFEGQQLNKLQVWSVLGDRVILVTYGADASEFSQHLPTLHAIIESLQLDSGAQVQQ